MTVRQACRAIDALFNSKKEQRRRNGNSDRLVRRHYDECKEAIKHAIKSESKGGKV